MLVHSLKTISGEHEQFDIVANPGILQKTSETLIKTNRFGTAAIIAAGAMNGVGGRYRTNGGWYDVVGVNLGGEQAVARLGKNSFGVMWFGDSGARNISLKTIVSGQGRVLHLEPGFMASHRGLLLLATSPDLNLLSQMMYKADKLDNPIDRVDLRRDINAPARGFELDLARLPSPLQVTYLAFGEEYR